MATPHVGVDAVHYHFARHVDAHTAHLRHLDDTAKIDHARAVHERHHHETGTPDTGDTADRGH